MPTQTRFTKLIKRPLILLVFIFATSLTQPISHSMLHFVNSGTLAHYGIVHPDDPQQTPVFTTVTIKNADSSTHYTFQLYTITYATTVRSKTFCTMAASAAAYGFALNVIGEGRQAQFDKEGCNERLWVVKDFVDYVHKHTLVHLKNFTVILFIDAYDVLFNGTPKVLIKRLLASHKNILFGSEKGCCGTRENMAFKNPVCDPVWLLPEQDTTTPYLNAGGFVGFIGGVVDLLDAAKEENVRYRAELIGRFGAIYPVADGRGPWDPYIVGGDQQLICHLFSRHVYREGHAYQGSLLREKLRMSLDYASQIFVNIYNMQVGREIGFTQERRVFYNASEANCASLGKFATGCERLISRRLPLTFPIILHFNGPGKEKDKMSHVARRIVWSQKKQTHVCNSAFYSTSSGMNVSLHNVCSRFSDTLPILSNLSQYCSKSQL